MTEATTHRALEDSAREVLEKMFFVEIPAESLPRTEGAPRADDLSVRIAFEGDPPGSLTLRLSPGSARQIAADFLALDEPEVSGLQISEVVGELANMICGSVLSRLESAVAFRLGPPRPITAGEDAPGRDTDSRLAVDLSNGRLLVELAIDSA